MSTPSHFVWAGYNYTCGECSHVMVLDHRSYEKEKLVRVVVYCRNDNCPQHRLPYELDTAQLKVAATPYGSAKHKRESGAAQTTPPGVHPDS